MADLAKLLKDRVEHNGVEHVCHTVMTTGANNRPIAILIDTNGIPKVVPIEDLVWKFSLI